MILYSELTDGSQFSEEKNGLKIFFLVPQIIKKQSKIRIIHFLWDSLYSLYDEISDPPPTIPMVNIDGRQWSRCRSN